MNEVFTIGHSVLSIEDFFRLLKQHNVTAIADVRSRPYSRFPHFNRELMHKFLSERGVSYVFLGKELGARPDDESIYDEGRVVWGRLAASSLFKQGIDRIVAGSQRFRIALLCAEHDPLTCHRAMLVSRDLHDKGVQINHILAGGRIESHEALEERLLKNWKLVKPDLFRSRQDLLADAYRRQEQRIAWQDTSSNSTQEHPTLVPARSAS